MAYTLAARAWDARRTDAAAEGVRKVRTLTGNFQLAAWLPALLVPIRNPVWFQFVSHKLLRLATPWLVLGAAAATAWLVVNAADAMVLRLLGVALAAALAACLLPPVRRRVAPLATWAVSLNSALVRASLNGVRGHWDVW